MIGNIVKFIPITNGTKENAASNMNTSPSIKGIIHIA